MGYQTYTTEALVCGTWNKNTADKSYLLFTKVAGMLYADARSVREEKSKQRFALQDFSYIRVSLVRGKQNWRIGSVEALRNHYKVAATKEARGSVVDLYRFLRRFYNGEEPMPELFDYLLRRFSDLENTNNRELDELVTKLHILAILGYVNRSQIPESIQDGIRAQVEITEVVQKKINKLIEQATTSSQL